MSDYSYVPHLPSATALYEEGGIAVSRTYIGDYKVGYTSGDMSDVQIRYCFVNTPGDFRIALLTNTIAVDFIVRLCGPTGTVLETSRSDVNFTSNPAANGYDAYIPLGFDYDSGEMTTAGSVYSSGWEAFQAMKFDDTPATDSGVVVTALASPLDTPVSTDGVIVTAIARLLDPNDQGGTSDEGGGQGTFDETSDVVPIEPLPELSAANSGLITLFRPSLSELNALGAYLWTNLTDFIENLQKMFSNPMDYFIAFHIVPCIPEVLLSRNIKLGLWETNVSMPPVASQWYEFNCGTVSLSQYWGSALDYSPYTKVSLFLPFIGSVSLNTDEVMGKRVGLLYRIDLLSGQCVAIVTVEILEGQAPSVLYQFTGECSVSVPLTGADWSRVYQAAFGAVGSIVAGGAGMAIHAGTTGGANAALAGARAANSISKAGNAFAKINATSKGVKGVAAMREQMLNAAAIAADSATAAASEATKGSQAAQRMRLLNTVSNTVSATMGTKYQVQHAGSISGSAGMLGNKTPYLLVEYPNQSLAKDYKHYVGYPANLSGKLSEFGGYTECEQVIPGGFTGTDGELAEVLDMLKGGVYL